MTMLLVIIAVMGLLTAVVVACENIGLGLQRFGERRRLKRAAKTALRQKAPPVSRHAVLNPAELKAKR